MAGGIIVRAGTGFYRHLIRGSLDDLSGLLDLVPVPTGTEFLNEARDRLDCRLPPGRCALRTGSADSINHPSGGRIRPAPLCHMPNRAHAFHAWSITMALSIRS